MKRLAALQQQFVAHMYDEDVPAPDVLDGRAPKEGLLGIYTRTTYGNLTDVLKMVYPAIVNLVGEQFFTAAARRFIKTHPSRSGNLEEYGAEFIDFLSAFTPAQSLPYLPDVARLEWCYHLSSLADMPPPVAPDALKQFAEGVFSRLAFVFHPSVYLMASEHPVARIWLVARDAAAAADTPIDVGEEGEYVLISRLGKGVEVATLAPAEYALLRALQEGATLYDAYEAAVRIEDGFALEICLQRFMVSGIFCDVSVG